MAEGDEKVIEDVIAKNIDFYLPPILFVVGVTANIFVVMVMQSRHFRHMSTSFYMSVSSSTDLVSLLVSLPVHYLYVNFPQVFDNARGAHAMCGFFNLFGWGSSDVGVLLTVAMTTERSLAIKFPLKAKVTALLCVVDLSDPGYKTFYEEFWPYIHNIFLLIAFTIIIIGNVIITVHVRRSEDKDMGGEGQMQKSVGGGGAGKGKMASKTRQLSLMLIIDSATIVLCTLPFSIFIVISDSIQVFDGTPQGRGMSNLVFAIVFYLLYVNRCANFFLYCVSGARFRQALRDILQRKPSKRTSYITGVTNTRNVTNSAVSTVEGNGVCMEPVGERNGSSNHRDK
nr:hypothetical protein BaRGS_024857 [Batillaria attramentaria]